MSNLMSRPFLMGNLTSRPFLVSNLTSRPFLMSNLTSRPFLMYVKEVMEGLVVGFLGKSYLCAEVTARRCFVPIG